MTPPEPAIDEPDPYPEICVCGHLRREHAALVFGEPCQVCDCDDWDVLPNPCPDCDCYPCECDRDYELTKDLRMEDVR